MPAIDGAAAANMLRDDLTSRRRTFVLYIFAIIALSWSCGWQMYEYAFNESTNAGEWALKRVRRADSAGLLQQHAHLTDTAPNAAEQHFMAPYT